MYFAEHTEQSEMETMTETPTNIDCQAIRNLTRMISLWCENGLTYLLVYYK